MHHPTERVFPPPAGFVALNCDTVKDYVAARPQLAKHVGPADTAASWTGALRCAVLRCAQDWCAGSSGFPVLLRTLLEGHIDLFGPASCSKLNSSSSAGDEVCGGNIKCCI